jgi:enolase
MVLIVLRHGESVWNKENKFTGFIDVELSDTGIKEATDAGHLLKNYHFNWIYTSALKRSIQTAHQIVSTIGLNQHGFFSSKFLNERNYGEFTGRNKDGIKSIYGSDKLHEIRRSYWSRPPGGENLDDVKKRVGTYFDNQIIPSLNDDVVNNVLIVAHGNSLRALFVHLGIFNETTIQDFEIPTAVPILIDIENKTFSYINKYELVGSQIIDSRGYPTIEVACYNKITRKMMGKGSSPSGASCGSTEVLELRDAKKDLYFGKSVFNAISKLDLINQKIVLSDKTIKNLKLIDCALNELDTTPDKNMIGGNTTTAVSFCIADVASRMKNMELFEYIYNTYNIGKNIDFSVLPTPLVNIINGGKHGVTDDLKIQEFMIFPKEDYDIGKKMQIICEVYNTLQKLLVKRYGKNAKAIGDEGGFCPPIYTTEEALCVIEEAIAEAGYICGENVFMALDCAASEFYDEITKYYEVEKGLFLTSNELIGYYRKLIENHPGLKSIEDGFHESDYEAWQKFTSEMSDKIMIVGDDLFTTNPKLIKKGMSHNWANTLLLKVNQIGSITDAIEGAHMMFQNNNNVIVSHRSGETNHAYIVDIAVGIGAKYLKIGSPCRGERVAKFNRLVEIDRYLKYTGYTTL